MRKKGKREKGRKRENNDERRERNFFLKKMRK